MRGKLIIILVLITTIISCNKEKVEKETPITPKIDFIYEVDDNTKTVDFINTSIGTKDYIWSFDDGETSNKESPIHSFKTEGSFKVRLSAKIKKTEQEIYKEKTIEISDIFTNKAEITFQKEQKKDFAGFTIAYDITNRKSINKLHVEISKDKTFSQVIQNKEVDLISTSCNINNLEPNTTYWYRIAIKYKEKTKEKLYYSEQKEILTHEMPKPDFKLVISKYFNSRFSIFTKNIISYNCPEEAIKLQLEVSKSKEFKRGYYAKYYNIGKDIYRVRTGPKTKYYIRYTATYKNSTTKIKDSCEIACSYYYTNIYEEGKPDKTTSIFGDNIETKKIDDKTIVEITNNNKEKIIFQIKNFKGLGKYKLANLDESYGYFLDAKSDKKYYLANKEIYLQAYRQSDKYYYVKISDNSENEKLLFRQDKEKEDDEDEEIKEYKVDHLYFVINK